MNREDTWYMYAQKQLPLSQWTCALPNFLLLIISTTQRKISGTESKSFQNILFLLYVLNQSINRWE